MISAYLVNFRVGIHELHGPSSFHRFERWMLWSLLISSCLLTGCAQNRTIKDQTGMVYQISGGLVANRVYGVGGDVGTGQVDVPVYNPESERAYFVFYTSIGVFGCTSDDIRRPEQIVDDFRRQVDALTNTASAEPTITISVMHITYYNWTEFLRESHILFNNDSFWVRRFVPPLDFSPSFEIPVKARFYYHEFDQREPKHPSLP